MKKKAKITRKEAREHLDAFKLGNELIKVINHFFPDLLSQLKSIPDPRHKSYITYESHLLLVVRILSSIFYISSMRKTSEEFNREQMIQNILFLCGEEELEELPYWETINNYLKKLDSDYLQELVISMVHRLLRMRKFEDARIRNRYWQIIIDGTQLESSREELSGKCLYRIHNKGKENEYTEYYYYVLEAKIVLGPNIVVSILTEFVENETEEFDKQDCELKAAYRLIERLKNEFPMLPICISADSLYAGAPFFNACKEKGFHYLIRFKEGSIPTVLNEYKSLRQIENNYEKEEFLKDRYCWYDHVGSIDHEEHKVTILEYGESDLEYSMYFLTDLPVNRKNQKQTVLYGRRRWLIENQGFNKQKKQGYNLEHMYSKDYCGMRNHYYLIQISHMISQLMENVKVIWEKVKLSIEQKHKRLLEAFKNEPLNETLGVINNKIQIRFD